MKKLLFLISSLFILIFPVVVGAEETDVPESEILPPEGTLFEQEDIFSTPVKGDTPDSVVAGGGSYTKYPNSNITVKTGDILVSSKSYNATRFVGHAAIVGRDHKVKEVRGVDNGGTSKTLSDFRFQQSGEAVKVYRYPNATVASAAGIWATDNVSKVTKYSITNNLSSVSSNYCSKFVYQAFQKGAGVMIVAPSLYSLNLVEGFVEGYVFPSHLNGAGTYIGSFK